MERERLEEILRRPSETLQCELKSWLDIDAPDDKAKVARALIALRNRNGGLLIFGFDNKTLTPASGRPKNLREAYSPDKVQELVKKHAQPPFPVEVAFGERDGAEFPVLVVPAGIRFPVISKQRQVSVSSGESLLRQNAVYFRTVNNGRVESTEPRSPQDWNELLEICFDNREADVGRFLRRHMAGVLDKLGLHSATRGSMPGLPGSVSGRIDGSPPAREPRDVLDDGARRFDDRIAYLKIHHPKVEIPSYAAWREVGVVLDGEISDLTGQHLLEAVFPRHPHLSGWPLWIDSRRILGEANAPYPHDGGWEACVRLDEGLFVVTPMIDFWRIDPRGEFYHRRCLEEDIRPLIPAENRGTTFDIISGIARVAEALATTQAFSKGMLVDQDTATIRVAFRWTMLHGRRLISSEPGRDFFAPNPAYDNTVSTEVALPATSAPTALDGYVTQAVSPLFAAFGYQVPNTIVVELTRKTLEHFRFR